MAAIPSILTSVKKSLGYEEDDTSYDPDLIMYINTALAALNRIGTGPELGYRIEDKTATWVNFFGTDPRLNFVQSYVYLKVRLIFDPPGTSFAIKAMEDMLREFEFSLNIEHEKQNVPVDPNEDEELPDVIDGGTP